MVDDQEDIGEEPLGVKFDARGRREFFEALLELHPEGAFEASRSRWLRPRAAFVTLISMPWISVAIVMFVFGAGWGLAIEFRGEAIADRARAEEEGLLKQKAELVAAQAREAAAVAASNEAKARQLAAENELLAVQKQQASEHWEAEARERDRYRSETIDREKKLKARTQQYIEAAQRAQAQGELFDAVLVLSHVAERMRISGIDDKELVTSFADAVRAAIGEAEREPASRPSDGD